MIYFRGTDDKLWQINADGSSSANLGGYKTKSTPIAFGDFLYFEGTDDKLWRINLDGSGGINLGGYKTQSPPAVTIDGIYFQGTDDTLWHIGLDGSSGAPVSGWKTSSTPVVRGGFIYFRGTDDKLWRINLDGSGGINVGLLKAHSAPFVTAGFIYFQGTDDTLWRVGLEGSGAVKLGGWKTSSTPYVTDQFVYFQGTDDKLWRINLDGSGGVNLGGGYKSNSSPVVDTESGYVYFQGTDDALWRTDLDGSDGTRPGGFKTASPPFVVQPSNQPQTGSGRADYYIITVLYAPPGTNGGHSSSSVEYGSSSSLGTTVSVDSSFTGGLNLGIPLVSGLTGDFGISDSATSTSSLEVKKSTTITVSCQGPGSDGIDHDEDIFYLWLNPQVDVTVDPADNLNWQLGLNGPTMTIQRVYAKWLKDPASMPPGVRAQLDAAGLTGADYATILSTNPFASGQTTIDPGRFTPTTHSFPYAPPLKAVDPVPTTKQSQTNSLAYPAGQKATLQYSVGLGYKWQSGGDKSDKNVFSTDGKLTWTNSETDSTSVGFSESATVTVGGPAFGYPGPTDVLVYWDDLYGTFMFAFATTSPSMSGVVHDQAGKPWPHQLVTFTAGSKTFTTYTDPTGKYRFYNLPHHVVNTGTIHVHGGTSTMHPGPSA